MNNISGIIIAKNEEEMIRGAIESLNFCNEVLVIDTNSTDKTKFISEKLGAKVFNIDTNDFAEKRNFGKEKAASNWILYVDADERVSQELAKNIKDVISSDSKYSAFKVLRKNYYLGKNEWPATEKMVRLFKKSDLKEWFGRLHESPRIEGEIGQLSGFLLHFTHRDLETMVNKTVEWSTAEAFLRYNSGHPKMTWWRFPRVMISEFLRYYIGQRGFKLGTAGLVESIYQSFSIFITYAKLWELQKNFEIKKLK